MKSKSIKDGVKRTFVLILNQGEAAFKSITDFAEHEKITGASTIARISGRVMRTISRLSP
jgi:hypothetical protein